MRSRLALRDIEPSDLPILFEHQRQPDANRMGAIAARDEASFKQHWERVLADRTILKKAILFQGDLAGDIVSFGEGKQRKVGYWIGQQYWGKGIATEDLGPTKRRQPGSIAANLPARARQLGGIRGAQELEGIGMSTVQPDGFLASARRGNGIAVLVLHAWWGLNDALKAFATRLGESGYTAFAPDLYHGKLADNVDDAEALSGPLFADPSGARADLARAIVLLNERIGQPDRGLAVIGFSLGAYFALELSVTAPDQVRSVVIYYGTRPGDYRESRAAYLGHFAEVDPFEPQSAVDDLEGSLREAGRPARFYRYPGTGHWFAEPDRQEAFNQPAADLAWERTLAFLRETIPGEM